MRSFAAISGSVALLVWEGSPLHAGSSTPRGGTSPPEPPRARTLAWEKREALTITRCVRGGCVLVDGRTAGP